MKTLTYRQECFCQAFVQGGNASHAAISAGYRPRSRRQQGWRLMKTARIRDQIREIQAAGISTLQGVAEALNARGVRTARDKKWFPATVKKILTRQTQPNA